MALITVLIAWRFWVSLVGFWVCYYWTLDSVCGILFQMRIRIVAIRVFDSRGCTPLVMRCYNIAIFKRSSLRFSRSSEVFALDRFDVALVTNEDFDSILFRTWIISSNCLICSVIVFFIDSIAFGDRDAVFHALECDVNAR